ncbi:MAG: 4Fe-4S dicluster domain-containing protein [bacterium]|nr:4Fe-4S dicluster domain-containing protein [bacterium]
MSETRRKKPRGKARLIEGKCIACGDRCQASCPFDAVEMSDGEPVFILTKCNGCGKCVKICPSEAIELIYTPDEQKILDEYSRKNEPAEIESKADSAWKHVWVFVEQTEGEAHPVSWELLGVGRQLADDLGVELAAFILGDDVGHLAHEAFGYGADRVYLIDDPILSRYRTRAYLEAGLLLIRKYKPEIVLMGATGLGRDLAGALATELRTGLTADCTGLSISLADRLLEQTRPAFGGNIMATILSETARPQMASVRPHVMPKPAFNGERRGPVIQETLSISEDDIPTRIVEIIREKSDSTVNLAGAHVIVSGGRGMKGPEHFWMIRELAELLGGVVGCSRSVVDAGWLPYAHQVGQTGKTVKPKLYIACGISGAIQHLVGMQNSDYIIAINKDKNAPIFDVAHLGIVGDVFDVLPAIIEKTRASLNAPAELEQTAVGMEP